MWKQTQTCFIFHGSHFPHSRLKFQKQKNHNVIFLFRFIFSSSPLWHQQQPPLNVVQKAREERKSEQTKIPDILNNLHAFFAFSGPGEKQKQGEKMKYLWESVPFYGRNVKICVMSVMCFYFPLRGTRRNDLLGFIRSWCWARAGAVDGYESSGWMMVFVIFHSNKPP